VDLPEWTEGSKKSKDTQNAEDAWTLCAREHREGDIDQRYEHKEPVHDVPAALEVRVFTQQQTLREYLNNRIK